MGNGLRMEARGRNRTDFGSQAELVAYSVDLPAAFAFAHLARAAAASLALTAGLPRRSAFFEAFDLTAVPFTLAHLALAPAAILARAAADMRRFFDFSGIGSSPPSPAIELSSRCSVSIRSLMAMIRLS